MLVYWLPLGVLGNKRGKERKLLNKQVGAIYKKEKKIRKRNLPMNKFLYSHRPRLAIILYKQSSTIASSESIQKKKDPKYVLSDQYTGENKLSTTKRLPRMHHLYILYLCIDVDDLIWRSFPRKTLVVSVKKLYNEFTIF